MTDEMYDDGPTTSEEKPKMEIAKSIIEEAEVFKTLKKSFNKFYLIDKEKLEGGNYQECKVTREILYEIKNECHELRKEMMKFYYEAKDKRDKKK